MNSTDTTKPEIEKVGVLLVHGIGEQCQFEHLENEVRNIVTALKKSLGETQTIQVQINSFPTAAFNAPQETWQDGEQSPVMVEVYDDQKVTQIYFHQVWWADLDEPTNLWSEIRFWLWGLSLWTIKGKFQPELPGSVTRMQWPNNVQKNQTTISGRARARLFWVSLVILLILPVLSLLNFVLRRVLALKIPSPDILAQFVGDVKLFQQEQRIGKGPLHDFGSRLGAPLRERMMGLRPRVTLRRRMIRGLVEMALRRYDRWYILAHSQGTVLAFNGIMETAQSLPNYLTNDLWSKCRANSLIRTAQQTNNEALTAEEKEKMEPFFPSWRDKEYILDRSELFKNLRGLLTYGSPLSKFAALWPKIVLLNQDSHVFHKNFQWLNVYDPTDPVAGATQTFQLDQKLSQSTNQQRITYKAAESVDFAYKADRFHLLSHVEYLTLSKGDRTRLVDIVANWLVEGNLNVSPNKDSLTIKQGKTLSCLNPSLTLVYEIARETTWVLAAFLIGSLLSVLISAVPQLSSFFQPITSYVLNLVSPWLQLSVMPPWLKLIFTAFLGGISYVLLAAIVVVLTGIAVRVFVRDRGKL